MAFETNRWTALAPHQTDFYRGQLHAAQQILHSTAAREAGVIPLAASQFTLRTEENIEEETVMWHDPGAMSTDGVCIVVGKHDQHHTPSAFIRVGQTAEHFMVEGVVINSALSGKSGVYGTQLITKHDTDAEAELHASQVGADFFATSGDQVTLLKKPAYTPPAAQQAPGPRRAEILGISGLVSARLINSLGSLSANLAVNGATSEQTIFTGVPYDLAQALFKTAIHNAASSNEPDSGSVIYSKRGPSGAIFESATHGITVVRRASVFPNAIAIATAGRPPYDSDIVFVEQHSVYAQFATSEFTTIPAEAYNPPGVINALGSMDTMIPAEAAGVPTTLDANDIARLQHKIMSLLTERSGQLA